MIHIFRGDRLKDLREEAGLGQKELADMLRISTQRVARYEQGVSQPPDSVKCDIVEYFGVSFDFIMGYSDDRNILKEKNCIVLPTGFPDKLKKKLKNYAVYLMQEDA